MLSNWFYKFKIGRTITALHSLDDATLKDIGIHRSNIRSHAYEIFEKENYFNEKYNIIGDYDLLMRISKYANAKGFNEPLINYRVHKNNFSKLIS